MPFLFGVCFAWLVLHAIAAVLKHLCGCKHLGIGLFSISVQTNKCNRCRGHVEVACSVYHVRMHMSQLTRGIQSIPRVCRLFYKFGRQHNAALRQWYSFGVAVAAMLGMSVIFMLLQDVWLAIAWIKEVCLQYYFCIECPSIAAMRKQLTFLMTLNFLVSWDHTKGICQEHATCMGWFSTHSMESDAFDCRAYRAVTVGTVSSV